MTIKDRDSFFDNGKFILIVLVVLGHLLPPFTDKDYFIYNLYLFIYSFHMPAFVFISGFFAKSFTKKENPIREGLKQFIVPYILFQLIYSLFYWLIGINDTMSFNLIVPNWSLWFLISSFFWRVLLLFFSKIQAILAISISIVGSLLAGYLPFIGKELTLQRTFVFFPFFLMGYYFKKDHMEKFKKSKWKKWFSIILPLIFIIIYFTSNINRYYFFGSKPYEDFLNIVELGALVRLFSLLLGIAGIIGFLGLVPTKEKFYTKLGKNTLTIYLFHGFIVRLLRHMDFPYSYLDNCPYIITFSVLLIISLGIVFILSGNFFIKTNEE